LGASRSINGSAVVGWSMPGRAAGGGWAGAGSTAGSGWVISAGPGWSSCGTARR
jgi:hypothetical protein